MGLKVIVNSKEVSMAGEKPILASYAGVVRLSDLPERRDYVVTWRDTSGNSGVLEPHEQVWIDEGMVFEVVEP